MKLRTLLASSAAILTTAVIAVAGVNVKQTDTGGICWEFTSGVTNTDAWCWSALGVLDYAPATVAADSATTNDAWEIAFTTPVDTTGTNTHNALTIDLAIGNATGGTNSARGLQVDAITGDAQVTETAVNIGSGWDSGISSASPITSTGDVSILTPGDLIVGAGTPSFTQNGEDAYITGTFEVDGAVRFDGTIEANSTLAVAGATSFDDNVADSPVITHQDATNETVTQSKVDAGALTFTSSAFGANDGVNILVGGLFVGNGVPSVTQNGEDAYIEGTFEVDGAAEFDGAVDFDSTITIGTDAVSATGLELDNYTLNLDIADGSADSTYWVVAPHAGAITACWTAIDGAVATADITVDLEINNVAVTGDLITIATAASAGGDVDTSTPSAANVLTAGQALEVIVAGGGAGGSPRVHLNCLIDR